MQDLDLYGFLFSTLAFIHFFKIDVLLNIMIEGMYSMFVSKLKKHEYYYFVHVYKVNI